MCQPRPTIVDPSPDTPQQLVAPRSQLKPKLPMRVTSPEAMSRKAPSVLPVPGLMTVKPMRVPSSLTPALPAPPDEGVTPPTRVMPCSGVQYQNWFRL